MNASVRPASASRRPARSLVWAWLVAFVLLFGIGSGQGVTTGPVAVDPSEFDASAVSGATFGPVAGSTERPVVTVASVASVAGLAIAAAESPEPSSVGCRDRGPVPGSGLDGVACDMPAPLADPSEHEPIAAALDAGGVAWLRAARRHPPPDPSGRSLAPLLRPPTA